MIKKVPGCNQISVDPGANAVYTSVGPNTTEITIHDLESGTEYTMMLYTRLGDTLSRKKFENQKIFSRRKINHVLKITGRSKLVQLFFNWRFSVKSRLIEFVRMSEALDLSSK